MFYFLLPTLFSFNFILIIAAVVPAVVLMIKAYRMDRLEKEYMDAAAAAGHSMRFINRNERNFTQRIGNPDTLIVFTNKISHEAKRKAVQVARAKKIPVQLVHSCGVSSLRDCLCKAQKL